MCDSNVVSTSVFPQMFVVWLCFVLVIILFSNEEVGVHLLGMGEGVMCSRKDKGFPTGCCGNRGCYCSS